MKRTWAIRIKIDHFLHLREKIPLLQKAVFIIIHPCLMRACIMTLLPKTTVWTNSSISHIWIRILIVTIWVKISLKKIFFSKFCWSKTTRVEIFLFKTSQRNYPRYISISLICWQTQVVLPQNSMSPKRQTLLLLPIQKASIA